jgi:hypothetical protein
MRLSRSKCASALITLAVTLALFVSGAALNYVGLNYSGDDGASGLKVHPYVVLTLVSTLIVAGSSGAGRKNMSDRRFATPFFCSLIVILVLVGKSLGAAHQSLGFAVDTLVAALWAAAVLPFLDGKSAIRIWKLGFVFVVVECVLAIVEVITKFELIPIDTWYGGYFRATALHGHPLNNALVLVTVSVALQLSARARTSIFIFLLTLGALSAFGARGALAVYLFVNTILFTRFGLRSAGRLAIVMFGAPAVLVVLGWVLLSGALGDRIANVGAYDDSSSVRVQSLQMLQSVDWSQLMVGVDPDQVSKIMDRADVGVIENFLVAYVFMFGLACTLLLFVCFWICARSSWCRWKGTTRRVVCVIFMVFVATALTNNSLVTKTPALYLCFVFAWSAAHGRERGKHVAPAVPSRDGRAGLMGPVGL